MIKKIYIALALNTAYLSGDIIYRLVRQRPFWRDLERRLQILPVIPFGRNDNVFSGNNPEQVVRYALKKKLAIYYGYLIHVDGHITSIEHHAFCVDKGRVVEPSKDYPYEGRCYYLGIPVPFNDIVDRRFELKFERMNYVLENLRKL